MNREPQQDANDPVWELLRQSPRRQAGPRFVDDTLRAARLAGRPEPWWQRLRVPLSLGGLATAGTAALAVFLITRQPDPAAEPSIATAPTTESLEVLDDLVRTEALSVAADYPAEFTDAELVSLLVY
jgi:hypothetical protein